MISWNLCDPEQRCLGIDVSPWQGKGETIDWSALDGLGVRWMISKWFHAGKRVETTDGHVDGARNVGMLVGRYVWWMPSLSDTMQVDAWCSAWDALPVEDDLPLTIDVEEPNTPVKGQALADRLLDLLAGVHHRTGRVPIVYTGDWYWRAWLADIADMRFAEYWNWHAAYPRKTATGTDYAGALREVCGGTAPRLAAPWREAGKDPFAWQFDGDGGLYLPKTVKDVKGDVRAVASGVDVDVNGADINQIHAMVTEQAVDRVWAIMDRVRDAIT
jgi:hypothetical protein